MSPAATSTPGTPMGSSEAPATTRGLASFDVATETRAAVRLTGAPWLSIRRNEKRIGPGE